MGLTILSIFDIFNQARWDELRAIFGRNETFGGWRCKNPAGRGAKMECFPIILVRGFDPMGDARPDPFYGFNSGTVYFDTVDASRIFEGFVVSFLKDPVHGYTDTSNVIRFHTPRNVAGVTDRCFTVSPQGVRKNLGFPDPAPEGTDQGLDPRRKTFWVFRYYDAFPGGVVDRKDIDQVPYYARELQRFIAEVKDLTESPKVNILCHSMGGIITRHLIQRRYYTKEIAEQNINKIVSLGTPHGGISYLSGAIPRFLADLFGLFELDAMSFAEMKEPAIQVTAGNPDHLPLRGEFPNQYGLSGQNISSSWDPRNWLCVVGTRYKDFKARLGTVSIGKQSDGLVRQENAVIKYPDDPSGQPSTRIPPRAYINKIHCGYDSLITSRESFEIATRFLFGTHWVKLILEAGSKITQFNSNSEYYLGASVKPRGVDFFLSQVDRISENCATLYKPRQDPCPLVPAVNTAALKEDIVLYEGALDIARSVNEGVMVFRIDVQMYAEDNPLENDDDETPSFEINDSNPPPANDQSDSISFMMGHSDSQPVAEQIIVCVNTKTLDLQWYQNSADVVAITGRR